MSWTGSPSLPHNERMTEHYRRLLKAEQDYVYLGVQTKFTNPDKTGLLDYPAAYTLNELFNDKGLIYLRHGEPDDVLSAVGGDVQTRTAVDAGELGGEINRVMDRLWTPIERSFRQGWIPNESWRYHHPPMDFHFVVEGGGSNWRLTPYLPLDQKILESRTPWGGVYIEMAREAEVFQNQRDEAAQNVSERAANPNSYPRIQALETLANQMAAASRQAASQALTTDRHTWPEQIEPLDVPLLAAAFQGDDSQTRLEIHYALPTGFITRQTKTRADSLAVELGLAVHDTAWQPRFEQAQTVTLPASDDPTIALTGTLTLSLPPDSYHVAVHARPRESTLLGAFQFEKRLPDFSALTLSISDLLPAYRIALRTETDTPTRMDFKIVPNPYLRFATSEPVHLYFELYHLTFGVDDLTRYTLEFTLRPLEKGQKLLGLLDRGRDEAALTIKMQREGSQTSPVETVEIDVSAVEPGRYMLTVRATDEHTGTTAAQSRPVELAK